MDNSHERLNSKPTHTTQRSGPGTFVFFSKSDVVLLLLQTLVRLLTAFGSLPNVKAFSLINTISVAQSVA